MTERKKTALASLSSRRASEFIDSPTVTWFITILILINAVTLGLETNDRIFSQYGSALIIIDAIILCVFTAELLIKLYGQRSGFFTNGWNWFDTIIVAIAWMPANGPFAILRALRILRVLRLLSVIPQMRRVISAIGRSIPGMLSIVGVLSILFYVCSVLATKLFGSHDNVQLQEWFGTLGASAYSLFQVMTLESWSMGIVRPVMEYYPWAWLFFVPFIIVTSFAVLNLFIGVIVDAMQSTHDDENSQASEQLIMDIQQQKILKLEDRLITLQQSVDTMTDILKRQSENR